MSALSNMILPMYTRSYTIEVKRLQKIFKKWRYKEMDWVLNLSQIHEKCWSATFLKRTKNQTTSLPFCCSRKKENTINSWKARGVANEEDILLKTKTGVDSAENISETVASLAGTNTYRPGLRSFVEQSPTRPQLNWKETRFKNHCAGKNWAN